MMPQTVFDSSCAAATPRIAGTRVNAWRSSLMMTLRVMRHDLAESAERVVDVVVGEVRPVVLALLIQLLKAGASREHARG